MSHERGRSFTANGRAGERGGSRLNFLIVAAVLAALIYAGYQFIPVAYQGAQLKVFMQDTVNNAVITDKKGSWVEDQLRKNLADYNAPTDARITVANVNSRMEAHVQYVVPIPLLVIIYQYEFDHTARSSNVLSGG